MKKFIKHLGILLPVIFLFTGCFDIKREIKFYPNGSGVEKIYLSFESTVFDLFNQYSSLDPTGKARKKIDSLMNNSLWEQNITNDFQRAPGTSLKEVTVTSKDDGAKEVFIHYSFDDPSALVRTVKEATVSIANKQNINFTLMKFYDEGDKLRFKYVLRNATRSYDDSVALNLFYSIIQSKRISYSIEMPFEVLTSNAQSQNGNILTWDFPITDVLYNQIEMTAEMKREPGIDIPYAEKVEKDITKVDKNRNPLLRVVVMNGNKEEVKIGTGIVLNDNTLVTNFSLMNILEGGGYFAVRLNNDSLAGIDEMRKSDLIESLDLCFMRFSNNEKLKTMKIATLDQMTAGTKVKILYYPNTFSSVVYSMDGTILSMKGWGKENKIIEIKPNKPLNIEGGAIFNDAGEFMGMVTKANSGEVGKIYAVPAPYIRSRIPVIK